MEDLMNYFSQDTLDPYDRHQDHWQIIIGIIRIKELKQMKINLSMFTSS